MCRENREKASQHGNFRLSPAQCHCNICNNGLNEYELKVPIGKFTKYNCLSPLVQPPGLNGQKHAKKTLSSLQKKTSSIKDTPWKINMEHNHGGLEDHVPF